MMEHGDTSGWLAVCKETMLQRSMGMSGVRWTQWVWVSLTVSPPLPLSHCHSHHHGGLSFLHSWPHYFLFLHLSLMLLLPPPYSPHIDWHEPISKTLISTKPQGTHRLQLFSCLTQSCSAVRTRNDTEEWNPWQYLNIINISWRWIWAPLLNIPLIAPQLNFYFLGLKLWTTRPRKWINNELLD